MPNHVHVLCDVRRTPLWKTIQSWKIHSTFAIKRSQGGVKLSWQREYWDTFMRSEEQERKAVKYIESNPVKAKLCRIPSDWQFSSARFRDRFDRLNLLEKVTYAG